MTEFSDDFGAAAREHLRVIAEVNADGIDAAARAMLRTVREDGLVYTAGSGHSLAMVMESFYRAGGLACVRPLFHPALVPLFGASASTRLERASGLADTVVGQAEVHEGDVGFVFSSSGVNAYPVEVAEALRAAGAYVVAIASAEHMARAEPRVHAKLGDVVDLVLDNRVPPGDAVVPCGSGTIGALSSLAACYLWNLVLVELARKADGVGVALPLWQSSNVPGGDDANAVHRVRYRPVVPML